MGNKKFNMVSGFQPTDYGSCGFSGWLKHNKYSSGATSSTPCKGAPLADYKIRGL